MRMSFDPYVGHHNMVFVVVSLLLCIGSFMISGGLSTGLKEDGSMTVRRSCSHKERQALLRFKASLVDIKNSLNDWGNKENDCCQWVGVTCNNRTGHVSELDLSTASVGFPGNISHLLPVLSQLEYLDLSGIDFQLNHIPSSLSSLTNLRHLNISNANLSGSIPQHFANLFNLTHLDISNNSLSGPISVFFGDLTSLTYLDLSGNRLQGVIPKSFGYLTSLHWLYLSNNLFNGSVPDFTGCPSLQALDLSWNRLTGNLPSSVSKLSNLEYLDVSSNSLEGVILDDHFLNLTQLTYLDLSFNSLALNLSSDVRFSFWLKTIKMQACTLGPRFPMWIPTQTDFTYLDISNTGIKDHVPRWFWDLLPHGLSFLNLSSNEISGTLPDNPPVFDSYPGMDLSNNQFEGKIPVLPSKLSALRLSGNKFSGNLSFLCQMDSILTLLDLSNNLLSGHLPDCWQKFQKSLVVLNLSNNSLSGGIPSSIGSLSELQALYLRRNGFTGEIPMYLSNCTKLMFLDLGDNKLVGNIPSWIGEKLPVLGFLILRANRLDGSLPSEICLLNNLQFLDLSSNGLSGNIPRCFDNFTAMANKGFQKDIMSHSYHLSATSYIYVPSPSSPSLINRLRRVKLTESKSDISYGSLPNYNPACGRYCIGKYPGGSYKFVGSNEEALFIDNALVAWKGTQRLFGKSLYMLKLIDISSNKLYGELPDEITNLKDLVSLNLSVNGLHGQIPKHMGRLRNLECLDLSRNKISGNIPSSLSDIQGLSNLDLSYNNLSGEIPKGVQLQGFNSTFYSNNPQLCGPPLSQICRFPPPTVVVKEDVKHDGDKFWKSSYYTGLGAGFVVGFLGICTALFFNHLCRDLFFASLNTLKDWIYVATVVHSRNFQTKLRWF